MKLWSWFILLLLVFPLANAATIHGSVYDVSLDQLTDVKVGINTEPRQQVISKDGVYEFSASPGEYTLTAFQIQEGEIIASIQEEVVIQEDGEFVIDLILFPNFEQDLSLLDDFDNIDLEEPLQEDGFPLVLVIIGVILFTVFIVLVVLVLYYRLAKYETTSEQNTSQPTKSLPADLQEVVDILKKEGGRLSQKELRKHFPLSEGKVSLMITDLEQRGLVEKIKKGRGNVVRLK